MTAKRPTLAEFSPEVLASTVKGDKLDVIKQSSYAEHRHAVAAPTEDNAARIERISNGEEVEPYVDRDTRIRTAANHCHDMQQVCERHHQLEQPIRQKALRELCKTFLPEERATYKPVAAASVELHAALRDYFGLKDYLIGEGGLVGICLNDGMERTFDHPTDRGSDFAMMLHEFVKMGVLDKIPAELRG
jgi:hypothetical protein